MKQILLLAFMFLTLICRAQLPDGNEILRKIDHNMGSDNKISESQMIIEGRRGTRTVESKSWIRGTQQSFTEYIAPPRDAGTKMLKLGDQLWTYLPDLDRTILIAGHMLRQSVMGSDLSYEDLMEDPKLHKIYNAETIGEDSLNNRSCWVVQLTAKTTNVAYFTRKILVDKDRFIALKEDRYAKSGKLLKTTEVTDVFQQNQRWIPRRMIFKDVLKSGCGTQFVIKSIEFDAEIPEYIFSKAELNK
jgi:hypothetical protein